MAKYGKKTQRKMKKVMHEYKHGKLRSGKAGKPVKSRRQAVAIGLSEARKEGDKVPKRKSSRKKKSSASRRSSSHHRPKSSSHRKHSPKRSSHRKSSSRKKSSGRKSKSRKK